MSGSPPTGAPTVVEHFQTIVSTGVNRGPIGAIVRELAAGNLSADTFERIAGDFGVAREDWFRGQVLDLFLDYLRALLKSTRLSPEHRSRLTRLRRELAVTDGEFMLRRPAEVAAIVDEQLERILDDGIIDGAEELEQVELQTAFGIGYDDYLLVSRRAFERIHSELAPLAERSPDAAYKLRMLNPLYLLVTSRPRTLGALF